MFAVHTTSRTFRFLLRNFPCQYKNTQDLVARILKNFKQASLEIKIIHVVYTVIYSSAYTLLRKVHIYTDNYCQAHTYISGHNLFTIIQMHTKKQEYHVYEIQRIGLLYLKEQLTKFSTSQCERYL
jgi:hypothetical protein